LTLARASTPMMPASTATLARTSGISRGVQTLSRNGQDRCGKQRPEGIGARTKASHRTRPT
jgi:hypothetical protein